MLKLDISAKDFEMRPDVRSYIEEKIGSLDKFIENTDQFAMRGWVEIGRTTKHHQSGDIFRVEAQIQLPGWSRRAEAVGDDIFLAIDKAKDELQAELKKCKEKEIARDKRGARIIKKRFHISALARFWRKGRIREEGV